MKKFLFVLFISLCLPSAVLANNEFEKVEELTGYKGQLDAKENVFKISVPRNDLKIDLNGIKVTPGMGLTSWVAFKNINSHFMLMGDLVLTEDQVNPVMSAALNNGLQVTALHNHFFWENPRVMFMHIDGMGSIDKLSIAVGNVFKEIQNSQTAKIANKSIPLDPAKTSLKPEKIDAILKTTGTLKDGVYKVVIGRKASMDNETLGATMGINTWAAFVGSDEEAVVVGDFAMHESELQDVLKALRKSGIEIVAIHQHMINEQPRFIFLHYYGIGNTQELARGLRSALDVTKP